MTRHVVSLAVAGNAGENLPRPSEEGAEIREMVDPKLKGALVLIG